VRPADSGFCRDPSMVQSKLGRLCLRLARAARLEAEIVGDLAQVWVLSGRSGKAARRSEDFAWSIRKSWSRSGG
jgi:hypothetical protein